MKKREDGSVGSNESLERTARRRSNGSSSSELRGAVTVVDLAGGVVVGVGDVGPAVIVGAPTALASSRSTRVAFVPRVLMWLVCVGAAAHATGEDDRMMGTTSSAAMPRKNGRNLGM